MTRNDTRQTPRIGLEWLGIRQATEYACVSERTLRSWVHSPVEPLPAVRVGGKIFVRRSELDAWLARHRVQPLATIDLDAIVKDALRGVGCGRKGSKAQGPQILVRGH
jgi:excisionase family DNA binding protein